jgi:hypothetical protein
MITLLTPRDPVMDRNGQVIATIVIALVSLALSAFAAYTRTDKDITTRLVTVEVQQKNDEATTKDRLDRIERKLDTVLFNQTGVKP